MSTLTTTAAPEPDDDPRERLARLREELDLARAQTELHRLRTEAKLLEHYAGFTGYAWGDLVDTGDAFRDADLIGRTLTGASRWDRQHGRNRPWVWNDLDLDMIRGQARLLAVKNPLVQGALNALRNFTVKTGYTYETQPRKSLTDDATAQKLAAQAQDVLDEFLDLNLFGQMEREACLRSRVDGETLIRSFPQTRDHTTLVRFVEPEQVRQPPGTGNDFLFGIHTDAHDIVTAIEYAIAYEGDNFEFIPAEEVSFLKLNVPSNVKRGLSDMFSTAEAFDGVNKLLRNMRESGAIQAAIAWIEQFEAANGATVTSAIEARRDQSRTYTEGPITGQVTNWTKFEPGSVVKVGKGREYLNAPLANNTTQHIAIVQACLRALGARWNMPEFMISGDASNNNYASVLVAGSPFVNCIECEQESYRLYFLRVVWTALRNAARAGRFVLNGRRYTAEELQYYLDVKATPPQVAISNKAEEATIDQADMALGVMSIQTRQARRGLDPDQEERNLKEKPLPQQQPQQQQQGQPGQEASAGGFFPKLATG